MGSKNGSEWEPDREWGWRGMETGASNLAPFLTLELCFLFSIIFFCLHIPPSPPCLFFFSLHPHFSVSCIVLSAIYFFPSICSLFLFIFGMVRDAFLVIPPLHHFSHPLRRREAGAEKGALNIGIWMRV